MKNITINLPNEYVEFIDNHYDNRSEIIRNAIEEFLSETFTFKKELNSQNRGVKN